MEQHNMSTTSLGTFHQPSITSQQQHQQAWHEQQQQQQQQQHHQHTNSYYTGDVSQQQHQDQSSYDHYNSSPFSSPLINTSNTMLMGTTSQRSSVQSLPSIHPIPSTSTSVQQHQQHQHQQQLQLQHQHQQQQQQQQQQHQHQQTNQRPRITTSLWDDEETVCYQVDVRGICVARRQGK